MFKNTGNTYTSWNMINNSLDQCKKGSFLKCYFQDKFYKGVSKIFVSLKLLLGTTGLLIMMVNNCNPKFLSILIKASVI